MSIEDATITKVRSLSQITFYAGDTEIDPAWLQGFPENLEENVMYVARTEFDDIFFIKKVGNVCFLCTSEDVLVLKNTCIEILDSAEETLIEEDTCVESDDIPEEDSEPCSIEVTYNNKRVDPCPS